MRVDRRPVDGLVACAARPGGVSAAVTEAGLMAHQDFVCAEGVAVWAACRRVNDPLPVGRSDELTLHT